MNSQRESQVVLEATQTLKETREGSASGPVAATLPRTDEKVSVDTEGSGRTREEAPFLRRLRGTSRASGGCRSRVEPAPSHTSSARMPVGVWPVPWRRTQGLSSAVQPTLDWRGRVGGVAATVMSSNLRVRLPTECRNMYFKCEKPLIEGSHFLTTP